MKNQASRIEDLKLSLESTKAELQKERDLVAERTEELQSAVSQLHAANEEIQNLRAQLESARTQINQGSKSMNDKSAELHQKNMENEYLQKRLKEIEDSLKKVQQERDEAKLRLGTSDQRENELFDKLRESDRIRKELHARVMVLIGSIRVFIRVRPPLPNELEEMKNKSSDKENDEEETFKFSGNNGGSEGAKMSKFGCDDPTKNLVSVLEPYKDRGGLSQRRKKWTFGFDQVFTPAHGQVDVWESTEPLVQSAIDGYSVTIFAYGQTGSGKSYTMLGDTESSSGNEGIISRSIRKLFDAKREIEEVSQGQKKVSLAVEMLEIYNEQVRDLVAKEGSKTEDVGKPLKIVGSEAVGSIHQPVTCEAEVFKILEVAQKRRCVKATQSNATSSRSHLLFSIEFCVSSDGNSGKQVGKLNICDLAGSERLSKSGATGALLKETQHINLSLSTLSNVIEKLQAGDQKVPFRDSKLTTLLQNSLGGNSKTLCIVCCNPLQTHFHVSIELFVFLYDPSMYFRCFPNIFQFSSFLFLQETLCSLRFAAKINKVDLKSVQNFSA
jgi:kinesin family protein C1